MLRFLFIGVLLSTSTDAGAADPEVVVGVVADGKPVPGAKAWLVGSAEDGNAKHKPPATGAADAGGIVRFPGSDARVYFAFAMDAGGRFGYSSATIQEGLPSEIRVELQPVAKLEGQLKSEGKPLAGVVCRLNTMQFADEKERGNREWNYWYPDFMPGSSSTTDAEGRFVFPHVIQGYAASVDLKKDGYAKAKLFVKPGVNRLAELHRGGSLQLKFEGVDKPELLKGLNWTLQTKRDAKSPTKPATSPVWPNYSRYAGEDELKDGRLGNVGPGAYTLSIRSNGTLPVHFGEPVDLTIESGQTTEIVLKGQPCAELTGRIVDAMTGKGVPKYPVNIYRQKDAKSTYDDYFYGKTDADGRYRIYAPGDGEVSLHFQGANLEEYQPPIWNESQQHYAPSAKPAPGGKHAFPDIKVQPSLKIEGIVVDVKGQPVPSPFSVYCPTKADFHYGPDTKAKTTGGGFTLGGLPPDTPLIFRIRRGKAVNVPESLTPEQMAKKPKFTISEANGVTFVGTLVDKQGKPIAGAKASLHWSFSLQEAGKSSSSSSFVIEEATTDAAGKFAFVGHWPGEEFYVGIKGDGFTPVPADINARRSGKPGGTFDFGRFEVARLGGIVRGRVIGLDGQPVAGAKVGNAGDAPKTLSVETDDLGRFELKGLADGSLFVTAQKQGYRAEFASAIAGAVEAQIVLRKWSEPPAEQPRITEAHVAAEKKMIRHMLDGLWKTRADHGWGTTAFDDMALFDRATAKKWANEATGKEKTDWKKRLPSRLSTAEILKLAEEDVEDAIGLIVQRRKDSPSYELTQIGTLLLAKDKARSLRLAEESALRARKYSEERPYFKTVSLAGAGELAWRAGNKEGGRKLIDEALAILDKAKAGRDVDQARGEIAGHLALMDWPAAQKVMAECADPNHRNSALSLAIVRIAETDYPKAKALLGEYKKGYDLNADTIRPLLAKKIALRDTDEALKLLDGPQRKVYRIQGIVDVALQIHPKDPVRAFGLIDEAFDLIDRSDDFAIQSSYGGRAALAAQIVHKARQIGYPDLRHLIARTLGFRAGESSYEPQKQSDWSIAYALAFTDQATARLILDRIAPGDKLLQKGVEGRRDHMIILALVDPDLAITAFDKRGERGWTTASVSEAGMSELLGSLVEEGDRMKQMTRWVSLPWHDADRE